MRLRTRSDATDVLPGHRGTVRVGRRVSNLLPRIRSGDVACVDLVDMDTSTAQALLDAGVSAVLNVQPMISGRYPNRGPQLLVDADVLVVDSLGEEALTAIRDGADVRVHEGAVHAADKDGALLAQGRPVDGPLVQRLLASAREGLTSQLDTFTHNASEFLRREQDLLLHGQGVPEIETAIEGRPVVLVVRGESSAAELGDLRRFMAEQRPVVIGVDRAADDLLEAGHPADVVVLSSGVDSSLPSTKALKAATDVIAVVPEGISREATAQLDRLGVRPDKVQTQATAEDVALLVADREQASVIVGVGVGATLPDFLDRQRSGLASTYLTRLKVGRRLVDASTVPTLYSGRLRPVHLLLLVLAGFVALVAAIAVTPAGQLWGEDIAAWSRDVVDYLRGLLP
ncbi:putative membrane-anchored protein [Nocardioides zeae]|uniref:Membrane-anchored protein n=2 Tax=Nocardioides zeae TaxID=1457234 RepID=A0ACC6IHX2_9ACTN|nr:putative cytokinetic ring protein SteA [Nocardioides zeae]MDQ1104235.1 putative membrane-anchored protein [Nocardioides zeae]MDR6176075.1 putative membrane-anchored protein [Nocardioides zeae]MDR6210222.1 putative membrane-anchored protein [Nocardioides zeae]